MADPRLEIIRQALARDFTDPEWDYFLSVCKYLKLNPVIGDIFPTVYNKDNPNKRKVGFIISRNGLFRRAKSQPDYDYIESFTVCKNDTFEVDIQNRSNPVTHKFGIDRGNIIMAYALIHRKDSDNLIYGEATLAEHYDDSSNTWSSFPSKMIKKTAEVDALGRYVDITKLHQIDQIKDKPDNILPLSGGTYTGNIGINPVGDDLFMSDYEIDPSNTTTTLIEPVLIESPKEVSEPEIVIPPEPKKKVIPKPKKKVFPKLSLKKPKTDNLDFVIDNAEKTLAKIDQEIEAEKEKKVPQIKSINKLKISPRSKLFESGKRTDEYLIAQECAICNIRKDNISGQTGSCYECDNPIDQKPVKIPQEDLDLSLFKKKLPETVNSIESEEYILDELENLDIETKAMVGNDFFFSDKSKARANKDFPLKVYFEIMVDMYGANKTDMIKNTFKTLVAKKDRSQSIIEIARMASDHNDICIDISFVGNMTKIIKSIYEDTDKLSLMDTHDRESYFDMLDIPSRWGMGYLKSRGKIK